jgi:hypothetical protein
MPRVILLPPEQEDPLVIEVPNGCDTAFIACEYWRQLEGGKTLGHQEEHVWRVIHAVWEKLGQQACYLLIAIDDLKVIVPTPKGRGNACTHTSTLGSSSWTRTSWTQGTTRR